MKLWHRSEVAITLSLDAIKIVAIFGVLVDCDNLAQLIPFVFGFGIWDSSSHSEKSILMLFNEHRQVAVYFPAVTVHIKHIKPVFDAHFFAGYLAGSIIAYFSGRSARSNGRLRLTAREQGVVPSYSMRPGSGRGMPIAAMFPPKKN